MKRPPISEWLSLFRATIAAEGITTGAGAGTGDSFIDAGLAGAGANSFDSMLAILYPGDPQNIDSKSITGFNNATGEVTIAGAYKGVAAAIPAGVPYKILTFRFVAADVAAIEAKLDLSVPEATFTYLDAGGEQTVFIFTPAKNSLVHTIWLDLTNLAQNNDIRIKIGGVTTETFNWTTGMDDGVYFRNIALPAGKALLVSMQETVDEGVDRAIPYYYAYEERE